MVTLLKENKFSSIDYTDNYLGSNDNSVGLIEIHVETAKSKKILTYSFIVDKTIPHKDSNYRKLMGLTNRKFNKQTKSVVDKMVNDGVLRPIKNDEGRIWKV